MKRYLLLPVMLLVGLLVQFWLVISATADPASTNAFFLLLLGFFVVAWQGRAFGLTPEDRKFLVKLGLAAYAARLLLGGFLLLYGLAPWFGGDFMTYHVIGNQLNRWWTEGIPLRAEAYYRYLAMGTHGSRAGFYYFIGALYALFGCSLWNSTVVMCTVGTLCTFLAYAIGRDMFTEAIGRRAGFLVGFFPSIVLWTCQAYKDGAIIFSLLLAYRCTQKLQEKVAVRHIIGLIAGLFCLYYLRGYVFYVATGPIILALTSRKTSERRAFYNQLAGIVIVGGIALASGLANTLLTQLQEVDLKDLSGMRMATASEGASAIYKGLDISTPEKAAAYFPIGLSYFLFAPFPWQVTSLRQAVTAPEVLMWWTLVPATVRGIRRAIRHHLGEASGILIFCTALTSVYALAQGNVGNAYRQRAQMLVFFFIFSAAGRARLFKYVDPYLGVVDEDEKPAELPAEPEPVRVLGKAR